jgi:hypothetical protein
MDNEGQDYHDHDSGLKSTKYEARQILSLRDHQISTRNTTSADKNIWSSTEWFVFSMTFSKTTKLLNFPPGYCSRLFLLRGAHWFHIHCWLKCPSPLKGASTNIQVTIHWILFNSHRHIGAHHSILKTRKSPKSDIRLTLSGIHVNCSMDVCLWNGLSKCQKCWGLEFYLNSVFYLQPCFSRNSGTREPQTVDVKTWLKMAWGHMLNAGSLVHDISLIRPWMQPCEPESLITRERWSCSFFNWAASSRIFLHFASPSEKRQICIVVRREIGTPDDKSNPPDGTTGKTQGSWGTTRWGSEQMRLPQSAPFTRWRPSAAAHRQIIRHSHFSNIPFIVSKAFTNFPALALKLPQKAMIPDPLHPWCIWHRHKEKTMKLSALFDPEPFLINLRRKSHGTEATIIWFHPSLDPPCIPSTPKSA